MPRNDLLVLKCLDCIVDEGTEALDGEVYLRSQGLYEGDFGALKVTHLVLDAL